MVIFHSYVSLPEGKDCSIANMTDGNEDEDLIMHWGLNDFQKTWRNSESLN